MAALVIPEKSEVLQELDAILQRLRWIASIPSFGDAAGAVAEKADQAQDLCGAIYQQAAIEAGIWTEPPKSPSVVSQEVPGVPEPATSKLSLPPLTTQQRNVFDVIKRLTVAQGYSPSIRQVGEVMGLTSSSTVHSHFKALERKGYIQQGPGPRTIRITA